MKNIVIIDKQNDLLIVATEGTGDNLLDEDERQGYKDYAMVTAYKMDSADLEELDGGQMMTECLISDLCYDDYAKRVLDFVGVASDNYEYVRY